MVREKDFKNMIKDVEHLVNNASIVPVGKFHGVKITCTFEAEDKSIKSGIIECDFLNKSIRITIK